MRRTKKAAPAEVPFRATYRLQLQKTFPFEKAAAVTSYLDDLGISHLYLSPVLESREGSPHGYDATDPTKLSEERGSDTGFAEIFKEIRKAKGVSGAIIDIVPNHVAASGKNPAWWDALKFGNTSRYWNFFDFRPRANGDRRVVLPVLGRSRSAVVAAGELQIKIQNGEPVIQYWEQTFPINPKSYAFLLSEAAKERESDTSDQLEKKTALKIVLKKKPSAQALTKWFAKGSINVDELESWFHELPVRIFETLLADQHYSLEEWRSGSREINYRRFFDINDLAAIRAEDPKTFAWSHKKIRELIKTYPEIQGLRVDHVDGLTNPKQYLEQLKKVSKYVWIEKILGEGEHVPRDWQTVGTTGYEFSGLSARLFVELPGLLHLHAYYTRHVNRRWERFHDCVYDSKREMLSSHFVSEMTFVTDLFFAVATKKRRVKFTKSDLHDALFEVTSSLRVYRTYSHAKGVEGESWLISAFSEVEGRGRLASKAALTWLRETLLGRGTRTADLQNAMRRWEQLTGPVMAKGLEDTALYRYFPLLSLNTVGGEPDWSGDGAIEFHAFNQERLRDSRLAMNATSTHDTKRSEDVRSRLHVISELETEWLDLFKQMRPFPHGRAAPTTTPGPALNSIDRSTAYLVCETLLGAWPFDGEVTDDFIERMQKYFLKAVREAKSQTSWIEPNQDYENALELTILKLLKPESAEDKSLLQTLSNFARKCSFYGAFNSLSLLVLKCGSPGLPDFYQGCELWDLSLVDPDNRRPVDYDLRQQLLTAMKNKTPDTNFKNDLLRRWQTGEIKLWLTLQLLELRKADADLFIKGEYFPLEPQGKGRPHFISFLRSYEGRWVWICVPRRLAKHEPLGQKMEIRSADILDTEFRLPVGAPKTWRNVFTGTKLDGASDVYNAGDVLDGFPVAVLVNV